MDADSPLGRPPERISLDDFVLRRWRPADAPALDRAVAESFDELHAWMAWAAEPRAPHERAAFIAAEEAAWEAGTSFSYGIFPAGDDRTVLGAAGIHAVRLPATAELGYWVHSAYTGRGIATRAAAGLTRAAFALPGVERVEIRCDAANDASSGVARRLGFLLERTEARPPEAPAHTGRFLTWVLTREDIEAGLVGPWWKEG